jgi:periplasmic protein TonB
MRCLPDDRTDRYLVVTVLTSLLLHVLVGLAFLVSGWLSNPVIASRGEALFAEIAMATPEETALPASPVRPLGPDVAGTERPRPVAPPPARTQASPESLPSPLAPRVTEAPKPAPRATEPREVGGTPPPQSPQAEEPAYEGRNAQVPSPAQSRKAQPEAQPVSPTPSPGSEPRLASVSRPSSAPPGMFGQPGAGGGFQGSQGGVVGQAVPLDTPDPNYREYMQRVRQRIYAKWSYPHEAQSRELNGKLAIEFHVGKDGQLLSLELIASSGEAILDASALNAIKMAEHYPPLPEAMRRDVLPIVAIFTYRIRTTQSSVFQLLQ